MRQEQVAFVAQTAVVEGDVKLGRDANIWHGAVVRGDEAPIVVGPRTNIQDNAVIHVSSGHPTILGEGVTVGHGAIVHGCTVGDDTLVGMGAIVLDGAVIGRGCIVGAGTLVTKGKVIPDGSVAFGSPARVVHLAKPSDIEANRATAAEYVRLARERLQSICQTALDQEVAVKVRRATNEDIPALERLLLQVAQVHADGRPDLFMSGGTKYTEDELVAILADEKRPIFVATGDADEVLGYGFCILEDYTGDTVRTHIQTLYIDDICVDEAARGRHVGTAVYDHIVAFARERGCHNVTLNVWSCNPGAQSFYEALGMKPYRIGMEQLL